MALDRHGTHPRITWICISCQMRGAPGIEVMLRGVAVAVFKETVLGAIIGVATIRRTAPGLDRRDVLIERPIGPFLRDAETVSHKSVQRVVALLAAGRTPAAHDRVRVL